jgi:hypothetical protein
MSMTSRRREFTAFLKVLTSRSTVAWSAVGTRRRREVSTRFTPVIS